MFKVFLALVCLVLFMSCAERNWNPQSTETDNDSDIQPYVFNRFNSFKFEVGGGEIFSLTSAHTVEFLSDTVLLEIDVIDYSGGNGTMVLNGEGNTIVFNQSLNQNQSQQRFLDGRNIPTSIQLQFDRYKGQVAVSITSY